jgi:predicted enzyme related to lactoylglutathione lyase
MDSPFDRSLDDLGNIVHLEHVNIRQPDQRLATLFYVLGLGFTRDPYLMVGLDNMWINIGRNQIHLPTNNPQRVRGTIGLVVPDLPALAERLTRVGSFLANSQFSFTVGPTSVDATCPWGNRFRCHAPSQEFGSTQLGIAYVEFPVPTNNAIRIVEFYREIMEACARVTLRDGSSAASVAVGRDQFLFFRETEDALEPYDGHHVQIYISDFSNPYRRLSELGRITRDKDPHEWRFKEIVDIHTNESLFTLEHEVRSLKHPLYGRALVNRNPSQDNHAYVRGNDAFVGPF